MLSQTASAIPKKPTQEHHDSRRPLGGEHVEEVQLVEPEHVGVEAREDEEADHEDGEHAAVMARAARVRPRPARVLVEVTGGSWLCRRYRRLRRFDTS